jgi:hypothetical protein
MKTPAKLSRVVLESTPDTLTPECSLCGEEHIGMGTPALVIFRGQWFPSTEYDAPVFLLDPDTKLRILQLPNGQLALVPDQLGHPTAHAHDECLEQLQDDGLCILEEDEEDEPHMYMEEEEY